MNLPFRLSIHWMNGPRNWVWIDFKGLKSWYVFIWRKGNTPFLYRSNDATPPTKNNKGKMIIGKYCC